MAKREPHLIDGTDALRSLAGRLSGAPYLALDTESNSLHAYREQVCWIQIECGGEVFLVDTVAIRDISALAPVLADPRTLKILHGADYDVLCLKRDFGTPIRNLFDTSIGAMLLGYPEVGLAALVQSRFGATLDKALAKHDWKARPVEPRALDYLAADVVWLHALCTQIAADIVAAGLEEEAEIEFHRTCLAEPKAVPSKEPGAYRRITGARELDRTGMSVLDSLWHWREKAAEQRNVPPFKVAGPHILIGLAQRRPGSRQELARIRMVPPSLAERHGDAMVAAVRAGLDRAPDFDPPRTKRSPRPGDREQKIDRRLRAWRKRRMAKEGLTAMALLPNHVIEKITARDPGDLRELAEIPGLGESRLSKYGAEILECLRARATRDDGIEDD